MKKYILTLLVVGVVVAGYFVFFRGGDTPGRVLTVGERFEKDGQQWVRFDNKAIGLSFEYRLKPDGYVLWDSGDTIDQPDAPVTIKNLVLFKKSDFDAWRADDGWLPGEGPAGMSIDVFELGSSTLKQWITKNSSYSNFSPDTKAVSLLVDGVNALLYSWEGLYRGETVALVNNGRVYLFSTDSDSIPPTIFNEFLASVKIKQ